MKNENQKKSIFERFTGSHKEKKGSCCSNFRIEEIPDEPADNKSSADSPKAQNNCCNK